MLVAFGTMRSRVAATMSFPSRIQAPHRRPSPPSRPPRSRSSKTSAKPTSPSCPSAPTAPTSPAKWCYPSGCSIAIPLAKASTSRTLSTPWKPTASRRTCAARSMGLRSRKWVLARTSLLKHKGQRQTAWIERSFGAGRRLIRVAVCGYADKPALPACSNCSHFTSEMVLPRLHDPFFLRDTLFWYRLSRRCCSAIALRGATAAPVPV